MAGASTIPNDMVLWLDGTQGITPDGTGLKCASWTSLVGGHVLSQPTAGLQPTLTTMNGLQCIQTDGVDDYLSNTTLNLPQPCTWFLVMKPNAIPSGGINAYLLDGKPGSPTGRQIMMFLGGPPLRYTFSATVQMTVASPTPDTNRHLLTGIYNGGSSVGYLDGIQVASGTCGSETQDGLTIGLRGQSGGSPFSGIFGEIIAYSRQMSTSELNAVHGYLKNKWQIT